MDIKDILGELNRDIDAQLNDLNNLYETPAEEEEVCFCPECGAKNPAGAMFCENCGTKLQPENDASEESQAQSDSCDADGIIWTDTKRLAEKYGDTSESIKAKINEFIAGQAELHVRWLLLDSAVSQQNDDWHKYNGMLRNFMTANNIAPSPKLSVFIIGGNDVILQPCEPNPGGDENDEYQRNVYADFRYCFDSDLTLEFLDFSKARCNIGRLPLETGELNTTFDDDIVSYFNLCNMLTEEGGIKIGRAVMTSNADWIPASREMSRNLPTEMLEDENNVVLDNMYISPEVAKEMSDDVANMYYDSLSDADMLVFNLHGASQPEASGFYSHTLAFDNDMLSHSNARIFNTVACWGGRYIKYRREESMLLQAMYGKGIMLYAGSCVPALGKCGNFRNDNTWRIQPAAYSETFMARYCEYLCIGTMSAGEAFLKAKCDYYNMSRNVEEDEYILATVLMFNLYGCPALRTSPDSERLSEIQTETGEKRPVPFRKMQRKTVMNTKDSAPGKAPILDQVRNAVDFNLRSIHDMVTRTLYDRLGLEPRELSFVESYSIKDSNGLPRKGYLYNYNRVNGPISSRIIAKIDNTGQLLDAVQTK